MKDIFLAIIISTFATTSAITALLFVPMLFQENVTEFGMSVGYMIVSAYAASSLIGVVIIGLPVHYLLKRLSITTITPYISIGFILPFIVVFILEPFGADPLRYLFQQGIISGILGAICAAVFWYLAARPDR